MKILITLMLFSLFAMGVIAQSINPDDTANIGDRLDDNETPAHLEIREEEVPNRPDIEDESDTPAFLEERMREEEIEEAEPDPFRVYESTDEIESLPAEQFPEAE